MDDQLTEHGPAQGPAVTGRHSRLRPPRWVVFGLRCLGGVAAAALLVFGSARTAARVPDPGTILLVAVVVSAYIEGIRGGLVASIASIGCLLEYLHVYGSSGVMLVSGSRAEVEIAVYATSAVLISALVGVLRQRTERRVIAERTLRERMEQLEQVKTHFLNVASHELRGPISIARGYVGMLSDGTFGPLEAADVRRAAPVLQSKLDEMNALVDSMLDAARLEEQRLVLRRRELDLRAIVDSAVQAVFPSLTAQHRLTWRRPGAPVTVLADEARITIVVTNLVQNAVKYSPSGGVIECFVTTDADTALLTVWDHGLGIAETDLPRLFTRFGRIVTPQNSHILGTGLGLYLARELARLHGGDLVAASNAGHGSAFTLVLPLVERPVTESAPREAHRRASNGATRPGSGGPAARRDRSSSLHA